MICRASIPHLLQTINTTCSSYNLPSQPTPSDYLLEYAILLLSATYAEGSLLLMLERYYLPPPLSNCIAWNHSNPYQLHLICLYDFRLPYKTWAQPEDLSILPKQSFVRHCKQPTSFILYVLFIFAPFLYSFMSRKAGFRVF